MLTYNNLSNAQKRFVDAVITNYPEMFESSTGSSVTSHPDGIYREDNYVLVTRAFIHWFYFDAKNNRNNGGVKFGYPNWLVAANAHKRGVYVLPVPSTNSAKPKNTTETSDPNISAESSEKNENSSVSDSFVEKILGKKSRVESAVESMDNEPAYEDYAINELMECARYTLDNSVF